MKISFNRKPRRHAQRGQAAFEFVLIGVMFLALFSGLVEMTYVYRAKHLLNAATFQAARAGSIHNAALAPMQAALTEGMAPLYMQGAQDLAGLSAAMTRASAVLTAMVQSELPPNTVPLKIINPTKQMFDLFSEEQVTRLADQAVWQTQTVMPNDNLEWRSHATQPITVSGGAANINLQDANLLKIRTYWCQRLVVPGLDVFFHSTLTSFFAPLPAQQMCDATAAKANAINGGYQYFYIAIESSAVVRMQSPVAYDGTNLQ